MSTAGTSAPARIGRRRAPTKQRRLSMLRWTASLGAVTAEALAHREGVSLAVARGRLQAAVADGELLAARPLTDCPALYALTPLAARTLVDRSAEPCRVRAGNAQHLIACAAVAAALERCYPDHSVCGEHELRRIEREQGARLGSAAMRRRCGGAPSLHRPDILLLPRGQGELPIAIEVELTVKAPQRLAAICQAWARCDLVAGVIYLATPQVERAVRRAIERAHAGERVAVVSLECLRGSIAIGVPSAP